MSPFLRVLCGSLLLLPALAWPQYRTPNAPLLGSAWYPEQWPEAAWDRDLTLMEQAHMNVVRIGEFAWSTLEPSEGHYDLDWLARAIDLAGQHHMKVVLGTPTDAPPAWLSTRYPDTLGTDANGRVREHGNRRQFSYSSPHYRKFCREIVLQLAQRFGKNSNIIGWQIGNEYTDESFDPATRAQFQQLLRDKYKTLDALNRRWSTAYWSQSYTAWSQIPLEATNGNPGLLLEHKHFVTATWRSFQQNQIDVLRPLILPAQFITTNIGGLAWSDNWDHYSITEPLDLASWDEYVGQGHLDAPKEAMLNDFVRGFKRQNFWIMETEPGSVNWAPVNNALAPGETRALAWQAVGHGTDAILYWQWRPALNGQEQYHGAIVGPDGKPNPIYDEIKQLGADFDLTRAALAGSAPHAEIALLYSYDSRWAIDFQPHTKNYDQQQVLLRFYEPLQRVAAARGQQVDIIDPTQRGSLDQYKLLVAPSLNVIGEPLAAKLLAWVRQGGTLLLGPRSGMKDEDNSLNPERQPGPLAAALGGKVEQYYAIDHPVDLFNPQDVQRTTRRGRIGIADTWAEVLSPSSSKTEINAVYSEPGGWLDGQPAVISDGYGKGRIVYVGTLPDTACLGVMIGKVPGIGLALPEDIEVSTRTGPAGAVAIYVNHSSETRSIELPHAMRNLLSTTPTAITTLTLKAQGVGVLTP